MKCARTLPADPGPASGFLTCAIPPWQFSTRFPTLRTVPPLRALLIYLLAVFGLGALAAPAVYALVQSGATHWPAWQKIADDPFHRYVHRSVLVVALAGIWPLMRTLGVRSWSGLGIIPPTGQGRRLGTGFALGFGSLAVVAFLALAGGARTWIEHPHYVKLAGAVLTAVLVALFEEILFRGTIQGALARGHRAQVALWASSAIYALVHFFQRPPAPARVEWWTGFATLGGMLQGFVQPDLLMPGFFTLLIAGWMLGLGYQRTGTLYFSIGLHAGWIFWLKSYNILTAPVSSANVSLWGTSKLIDGWLALGTLAAAAVLMRGTQGRTRDPACRAAPS
jgi:membrane protease YdiL (CAAX protease family)